MEEKKIDLSEMIDVQEAAEIIGLKHSRVRALIKKTGAAKRGRQWYTTRAIATQIKENSLRNNRSKLHVPGGDDATHRTCSKCHLALPKSAFSSCGTGIDKEGNIKLRRDCKSCRRKLS